MEQLFVQLFTVFGPIVADVIRRHQAQHGQLPTDEEMLAAFKANVDKYIAEGEDWLRKHPK